MNPSAVVRRITHSRDGVMTLYSILFICLMLKARFNLRAYKLHFFSYAQQSDSCWACAEGFIYFLTHTWPLRVIISWDLFLFSCQCFWDLVAYSPRPTSKCFSVLRSFALEVLQGDFLQIIEQKCPLELAVIKHRKKSERSSWTYIVLPDVFREMGIW